MSSGGLRSDSFRHCRQCGRALEPGEVCECGQVMAPGITRDGLRATCAQFRARSSYRRRHYLDCDGHKLQASSRQARDAFYAVYCCGQAETRKRCPFSLGNNTNTPAWDAGEAEGGGR